MSRDTSGTRRNTSVIVARIHGIVLAASGGEFSALGSSFVKRSSDAT
jgi:hypothetical protein